MDFLKGTWCVLHNVKNVLPLICFYYVATGRTPQIGRHVRLVKTGQEIATGAKKDKSSCCTSNFEAQKVKVIQFKPCLKWFHFDVLLEDPSSI